MKRRMTNQDFFASRQVFTHEEFVALLDAKGSRSPRTPDSLLAYHVRTGRLVRVRRGLYASVSPGVDPQAAPVDPYLVAAKLADDAVLAYHTALQLHGRAYSVYEDFVYLTNKATRSLAFRSRRYRGVPFPKALRDAGQELFGVRSAEAVGAQVRVTSLERTLVDVLDRPDLGGGWEEVWRSLESVEYFDLDEVVAYALLLSNATTVSKVGFYLEQHRDLLMVEDAHLDALRGQLPRQPHYLVRADRSGGRLVRGWKLVVPSAVLDRVWEEPA